MGGWTDIWMMEGRKEGKDEWIYRQILNRWADDWTGLKEKKMDGWKNWWILDISVFEGWMSMLNLSNVWCSYWFWNDQVPPLIP